MSGDQKGDQKAAATIQVGDTVPDATFAFLDDGKVQKVTASEFFANKKVALFAVPGAFTPTCSNAHCPSFTLQASAFSKKGWQLACTAVNDAFVMDAWAESRKAKGKIQMLADGNAEFAQKIGMVLDASGFGMGLRSKRYGMLVDNGVVKYVGSDAQGVDKSGADNLLVQIDSL